MSDKLSIYAINEGYTFLAQALLDALSPDMLLVLFPEAALSEINADELEVDHYRVFGINVYPYASVFLSADGLKGGAEAEASTAFYARVGWATQTNEPDHIAVQLGVLGWLAGAELEALEDGKASQVARIQALRRQFLDERVLTWLPSLYLATAGQKSFVYAEVVRLALELVAEDRAVLARNDLMQASHPVFALPAAPDLLVDPKTGLRDIAEYLMTPALSGLFFSRDEVIRLAGRHGLPTGFADRKTLLHNVLRGAVNYGVFPVLIADLCAEAQRWGSHLRELGQKHPTLSAGCLVWARRVDKTLETLNRVVSATLSD
jgi:TorA maturation chaperone TorD